MISSSLSSGPDMNKKKISKNVLYLYFNNIIRRKIKNHIKRYFTKFN